MQSNDALRHRCPFVSEIYNVKRYDMRNTGSNIKDEWQDFDNREHYYVAQDTEN